MSITTKPDVHTLIAEAERVQMYGSITLEFRRGAITMVRTEKTQVFDIRNNEERNTDASARFRR